MRRGLIMDAKEWDRIADLLMQIRGKYKKQDTTDTEAADMLTHMVFMIDHLLKFNDMCAKWDDKGWL